MHVKIRNKTEKGADRVLSAVLTALSRDKHRAHIQFQHLRLRQEDLDIKACLQKGKREENL